MKKFFILLSFFCFVSCASKPKPANDIDWDYVFPIDETAEYCEAEIDNDCLYYPPYFYN